MKYITISHLNRLQSLLSVVNNDIIYLMNQIKANNNRDYNMKQLTFVVKGKSQLIKDITLEESNISELNDNTIVDNKFRRLYDEK